jgi:voltage-gated potassium channel
MAPAWDRTVPSACLADALMPDPQKPKHDHSTFRFERWWERRIERRGLRPRDAAYLVAGFWAVAAVLFGVVERIVDPKTFHTVWLGIWWAIETVTTVGYGDVVPDQPAGKVIGAFLMLGGLSLLAIVTAAITSGFVARAQARRKSPEDDPVMKKLDQLGIELVSVKRELEQLRSASNEDSSS